jgi:hypothetical protein
MSSGRQLHGVSGHGGGTDDEFHFGCVIVGGCGRSTDLSILDGVDGRVTIGVAPSFDGGNRGDEPACGYGHIGSSDNSFASVRFVWVVEWRQLQRDGGRVGGIGPDGGSEQSAERERVDGRGWCEVGSDVGDGVLEWSEL